MAAYSVFNIRPALCVSAYFHPSRCDVREQTVIFAGGLGLIAKPLMRTPNVDAENMPGTVLAQLNSLVNLFSVAGHLASIQASAALILARLSRFLVAEGEHCRALMIKAPQSIW